jgi:glyoxylase-like metal-dependent hydrolase (beta-lactamase superfamily II)
MKLKQIFPSVSQLTLGPVNVFFIKDGDELVVVDTGYEKSEAQILAAVEALGYRATAVRNIVITHCHPDHAGSLAALQAATGAAVWMHHADAEVVRGRAEMVLSTPAPGLLNQILYRVFIKGVAAYVPPAVVAHEVADGQLLPLAGGLRAIHAPGHSAGHMAFLLERDGGLLFTADACSNMGFLNLSIVYDDLATAKRSLAKLAKVPCHTICFGHGQPLTGKGVAKFQRKYAA